MKRILFVCKHNIFRSKVAEHFFKKFNKNKKYKASSAGLISWNRKDLKDDKEYDIEENVCKRFGINLKTSSRGINSSMLRKTDIVIVTADDVHPEIFKKEKSFNGKVILWKVKDVRKEYKNRREKVALDTVRFLERKTKNLLRN